MAKIERSLFLAPLPGDAARDAEGSGDSACSCQEMEQETTPRDLSQRPSSSLTASEPMFWTAQPVQGGVPSTGRDLAFSKGAVVAPGGNFASGTAGVALLPSRCWCRTTSAPSLQDAVTCCSGMPCDARIQCQDGQRGTAGTSLQCCDGKFSREIFQGEYRLDIRKK